MRKQITGGLVDFGKTYMERIESIILNELEEMVQGAWAWSTNGET
jgi:hypothetical protein